MYYYLIVIIGKIYTSSQKSQKKIIIWINY